MTLVPWLVENIPDLQRSIVSPSLFFTLTEWMAVVHCTDDTFMVDPNSNLFSEAAIEKRFERRDRQFLPLDFIGVSKNRVGSYTVLSQLAYPDMKKERNRMTYLLQCLIYTVS